MKDIGYGRDYQYAHDRDDALVGHHHLPDELRDQRYYRPSDRGAEAAVAERLERARKARKR